MDAAFTVEIRAADGPGEPLCAIVGGDPGPDDGPALRDALLALVSGGGPGAAPLDLDLDMLDLDLDHGLLVACCVQAVDALRAGGHRLVLRHAPQMLAHTLYKVGRLADPDLVLVEPRHDTGFGAS